MTGIILAGGHGTRLYPATTSISKQMLPVYDKPMIYYPLATLLELGIQDIIVVGTPDGLPLYQGQLDHLQAFGVRLRYAVQAGPKGIAHALLASKDLLQSALGSVVLILGDNFIHGLGDIRPHVQNMPREGAHAFAYPKAQPNQHGVPEYGAGQHTHRVVRIEEKPKKPKSNYAIIGLYALDHRAVAWAKDLEPSARGELEITDLLNRYADERTLHVWRQPSSMTWLDCGTAADLHAAASFVQAIQTRTGFLIGSPELALMRRCIITPETVLDAIKHMPESGYVNQLKFEAQLFSRQ